MLGGRVELQRLLGLFSSWNGRRGAKQDQGMLTTLGNGDMSRE
jgi:hypothetical protein